MADPNSDSNTKEVHKLNTLTQIPRLRSKNSIETSAFFLSRLRNRILAFKRSTKLRRRETRKNNLGGKWKRSTEGESIATVRHELLVGHDKADGADHVHGPSPRIWHHGLLLPRIHCYSSTEMRKRKSDGEHKHKHKHKHGVEQPAKSRRKQSRSQLCLRHNSRQ